MPDTVHRPPPPAPASWSPPAGPSCRRPARARHLAASAWGLAVGSVAGIGMLHPGHIDGRLMVVAAIGAGPALVAVVPLFYLFGAMAWNAIGGEVPPPDATAWPVTLTYAGVFAVAGFLNALLWTGVTGRGLRRPCRVRARRVG